MKLFINVFLSFSLIKYPILQSAFSCPALLSYNLDIFSSKFSLRSTSRPYNVTLSEEVMTFSSKAFEDYFFGSSCQLLLTETFLG